jgi:hypothetical protein
LFAHLTNAIAPAAITSDLPLVAVAVMLAGIGVLLAIVLLADRGGFLPTSPVPFGRWTAATAAGLSWGAAAIHFAVIGEHFAEYPPYGVAFAALAWFQVGWAFAWVLGRRFPLALTAIAINAGALVVWAASRTVGLPVGPEPGELEPVGALDVLAGVLEAGLIALLAWDLRVRSRRFRPALSAGAATVVVGSVVFAVVVATSAAFASSGTGEHDHGSIAEPSPGSGSVLEIGPISTNGLAVELPAGASPPPIASTGPESAGSASPASPSPRTPDAPPEPATPKPSTARTATPRPTSRPAAPRPTAPPDANAGLIQFGSAFDSAGRIAAPDNQFREGDPAVWIANFSRAPGTSEITKLIVQVLPDGRVFEHWREQVTISDPAATRLAGEAELSLYAHGGAGSYRLRYLVGDELLAEGTFELVP